MRFVVETTFGAPPAAVVERLITDETAMAGRHDVLDHRQLEVLERRRDGATFDLAVRYRARVEPPGFARKLVSPTNTVTQREHWELGPDGGRADWSIEVAGAPVGIVGTMALSPAPAGSRLEVGGEVRVSMPVVGRRLARWMCDQVEHQIERQLAADRANLATLGGDRADVPAAAIVLIPFVTAAIGLGTNWLAIQMIFWPMRFVGVGPIGWQGVLPRRSDTFARDVATMLEERILSSTDLLDAVDLDQIEALLEKRLAEVAPDLVADIAELIRPGLWDTLAEPAQAMILDQVATEARTVTRELFASSRDSIDELIDLRGMVEAMLSGENTQRLVDLFKQIGGSELRWVIRFGGVFGFVIGLFQAAFYSAFQVWWVLPLVGAVVGLGTNWLALQMIFRPQEPRRVLGVTYQGLFPKRQAEIAVDYARIAEEEILTPGNLLEHLATSDAGARIAERALEVASARLEAMRPMLAALAGQDVTDEHVAQVQDLVVARIADHAPAFRPDLEAALEESLDIGPTVEGRLLALSKPEFERLLRGLFEQDELLLILVGGGLGLIVGLAQAAVALTQGG